jgi:hypothetical protein
VGVNYGVRSLFVQQRISQELGDLGLRAGCVDELFEDRDRGRIEQVRVPGQRIEDDGFIVEVPDQQAVDGC